MNTLTKEWLQNTITSIESARDEIPFGLDEDQNNMLTALKIALASLEAEPVASCIIEDGCMCVDGFGEYVGHSLPDGMHELYAAPPALVVPDEMDLLTCHLDGVTETYADGWNACHAAMLQGSQPVSQTYKLPVNTPCQDAPAHIWLQTAGVWPEDGELSELTWCSHNQHHDDTLYVRADLVNGNYPVTPDGWVIVPKKLTAENGAKGVLSGEFSETTFISCPECFGDDDCDTCDGSGRIEIKVPVTWTTIKSIWDKGIAYFAAEPRQEVK